MPTLTKGQRVLVNTTRGELICVVIGPRIKSPASGTEEVLLRPIYDGADERWVVVDEIHLPVEQLELIGSDSTSLLVADEEGNLALPRGTTEDHRGAPVVDDDWQHVGYVMPDGSVRTDPTYAQHSFLQGTTVVIDGELHVIHAGSGEPIEQSSKYLVSRLDDRGERQRWVDRKDVWHPEDQDEIDALAAVEHERQRDLALVHVQATINVMMQRGWLKGEGWKVPRTKNDTLVIAVDQAVNGVHF